MRGWVVCALLLGLFWVVTPEAMAGQTEAVRLHGLALRQGPDGTSPMLRALPAGETVTVTGRKGEYLAVTLADGTKGYVHGGFLTGFDDIAPLPAYAARIDPRVTRPGAEPDKARAAKASPASSKTPPADASPAPDKASTARASSTPRGADRPAPGNAAAAAPPPPFVYVPVADGGGLDRFLAGIASSERPASAMETDAAAQSALKNHFAIEVHLSQRKLFLYENLPDGSRHLVRQYVVAVPGRDMEAPQGWGVVTGISFEPSWRPTPAMKERALKKGKPLPEYVGPGVKDNPMGTFKIILSHGYGFRIHGNNNPGSIGRPVTSGCIRMRNDEGKDMAKMIDVGTEVVFLD